MNTVPIHDTIRRRMRIVYDEIASAFAREHAEMEPAVLESALRFLAIPRPPGPLLELGCGAGRDLSWFGSQGLLLTGADLSAGMLTETRARCPEARLCQMEMARLGFCAGVFVGLWCNAALLHLPRAEAPAALAEMHRVLRPGSPLFLSLQEGESENWETRPNRPERLFTRYRGAELEGLLPVAGFSVLAIRSVQAYDRTWLHIFAQSV